MGTIVLKMTAEQISVLQKDLASYATATKNPYAFFSAKVDGTSVIAYTSGKVTFQGAKPEILASRFGYQAEPKQSPDGQNLALIGSDEVGNGSYFGGLAVVALPSPTTSLYFLGESRSALWGIFSSKRGAI